jgi:hypothetical protein
MKISELIAELEHAQSKFGDIDVVAYKNSKWLDSVEKIIHLEVIHNQGAPNPKASRDQIQQWRDDPQTQPNSGWLPLKAIPKMPIDKLAPDVIQRKLYIGPKIVMTS